MSDLPHKYYRMNNILTDDLLLEVFYRLPCVELVTQCKCVCKLWCNLISSSNFVGNFITRKMDGGSNYDERLPSTIFIRYRDDLKKNVCIVGYPYIPAFTSPRFSLNCLPHYGGEYLLCEKAWCGDMILCDRPSYEPDLYICNPRTKQWLQLPPPSVRRRSYLVGLMYDPYYMFDHENKRVCLSNSARYAVCHALMDGYPNKSLEMEIFYSEVGSWKKVVLVTPEYFEYSVACHSHGCLTYNKTWLTCSEYAIVGFDPYNVTADGIINGHLIQLPPYTLPESCNSVRLGVYGSRILMAQYCARSITVRYEDIHISEVSIGLEDGNVADYYIKVWELKNYDIGEWSLERTIYLRELVSDDCILNEFSKRGCPNTGVFRFHPSDPDILLLAMPNEVMERSGQPRKMVECNLREKTLKLVCSINPKICSISGPVTYEWWPSPLTRNV